jgi:hypothetical protein
VNSERNALPTTLIAAGRAQQFENRGRTLPDDLGQVLRHAVSRGDPLVGVLAEQFGHPLYALCRR